MQAYQRALSLCKINDTYIDEAMVLDMYVIFEGLIIILVLGRGMENIL